MKILMSFIIFATLLSSCSVTYTSKDLLNQSNKNMPVEKDIVVGYFVLSKVTNISFDEKNAKVLVALEGTLENRTAKIKKKCNKLQISFKPYLMNKQFFVKDFKAESVDCLFSESVDTKVANLLKDLIVENRIKFLELDGIKRWLVDEMIVTEKGLKFKLSIF